MALIGLGAGVLGAAGFFGLSSLTAIDNVKTEIAVFKPLDVDFCKRVLKNCFYQNYISPYSRSVVFDSRTLLAKPDNGLGRLDQYFGAFFLSPYQALVVIGDVPPCRYWSFIPYLWRKGIPVVKDGEELPLGDISFSSLNDGFSNFTYPGVTKIAVVMTRNQQVFAAEQRRINSVNSEITVIPLWVTEEALIEAPLTYLFRTAFFIGDTLESFLANPGFLSYRSTYGVIGYSGVRAVYPDSLDQKVPLGTLALFQTPHPLEPSELPLEFQFKKYITEILAKYKVVRHIPTYPFLEKELGFPYENGQQCRDADINCLGDNVGTIYINSDPFELNANERTLMIAVNHSTTGRAFYSSINLYDDVVKTGIDGALPDPGTLFYDHVFQDFASGTYRTIERSYIQLPQNTAPNVKTILLGQTYIIRV